MLRINLRTCIYSFLSINWNFLNSRNLSSYERDFLVIQFSSEDFTDQPLVVNLRQNLKSFKTVRVLAEQIQNFQLKITQSNSKCAYYLNLISQMQIMETKQFHLSLTLSNIRKIEIVHESIFTLINLTKKAQKQNINFRTLSVYKWTRPYNIEFPQSLKKVLPLFQKISFAKLIIGKQVLKRAYQTLNFNTLLPQNLNIAIRNQQILDFSFPKNAKNLSWQIKQNFQQRTQFFSSHQCEIYDPEILKCFQNLIQLQITNCFISNFCFEALIKQRNNLVDLSFTYGLQNNNLSAEKIQKYSLKNKFPLEYLKHFSLDTRSLRNPLVIWHLTLASVTFRNNKNPTQFGNAYKSNIYQMRGVQIYRIIFSIKIMSFLQVLTDGGCSQFLGQLRFIYPFSQLQRLTLSLSNPLEIETIFTNLQSESFSYLKAIITSPQTLQSYCAIKFKPIQTIQIVNPIICLLDSNEQVQHSQNIFECLEDQLQRNTGDYRLKLENKTQNKHDFRDTELIQVQLSAFDYINGIYFNDQDVQIQILIQDFYDIKKKIKIVK